MTIKFPDRHRQVIVNGHLFTLEDFPENARDRFLHLSDTDDPEVLRGAALQFLYFMVRCEADATYWEAAYKEALAPPKDAPVNTE